MSFNKEGALVLSSVLLLFMQLWSVKSGLELHIKPDLLLTKKQEGRCFVYPASDMTRIPSYPTNRRQTTSAALPRGELSHRRKRERMGAGMKIHLFSIPFAFSCMVLHKLSKVLTIML